MKKNRLFLMACMAILAGCGTSGTNRDYSDIPPRAQIGLERGGHHEAAIYFDEMGALSQEGERYMRVIQGGNSGRKNFNNKRQKDVRKRSRKIIDAGYGPYGLLLLFDWNQHQDRTLSDYDTKSVRECWIMPDSSPTSRAGMKKTLCFMQAFEEI